MGCMSQVKLKPSAGYSAGARRCVVVWQWQWQRHNIPLTKQHLLQGLNCPSNFLWLPAPRQQLLSLDHFFQQTKLGRCQPFTHLTGSVNPVEQQHWRCVNAGARWLLSEMADSSRSDSSGAASAFVPAALCSFSAQQQQHHQDCAA